MITENLICHYSDLPSLMVYQFLIDEDETRELKAPALLSGDIDRIIEMAWEDKTPFDAIKFQFGLGEPEVRKLMKTNLKFSSYKLWRKRVESCSTKHTKTRSDGIIRFKSKMQRMITSNKISKRR
jgi:uncharacterized protein (TIGR03643 family)